MNNPTDKNGNIINIGDRVVYRKGTPDEDNGVVTNISDICDELWVEWSDGSKLYIEPEEVEVVSAIPTDTFTKQEEALLQVLLAKKEKADNLRYAAEEAFQRIINELYETSTDCVLADFVINNIDEICNVLQNYKRTVQTN